MSELFLQSDYDRNQDKIEPNHRTPDPDQITWS
jgi:hypothetical protein